MPTIGGDATPRTQRNDTLGNARARESVIAMFAFIVLLHVVGWGAVIAIGFSGNLKVGTTAFGAGLGLTAYLLGVRHAFDADHIAAIDNTTRKLMQDGIRPVSVGFWFSCGHSSVVLALTIIIVLGIRTIVGPVFEEDSELHTITGLIGTFASSGFLYLIAALNVVVLLDVWKIFRQRHATGYDETALEKQLGNRGIMSRLLGRTMKIVTKPWQMFVVGLLFGLGFDTATEIALLVLTSSGAASGLPWYAILCLPLLFAAGMSLFDTLDGSLMTAAYGWALANPVRKIYYNLVVTALSIILALVIGTIEIVGLLSERLNLQGSIWSWAANLDLGKLGIGIVALFLSTWLAAIAISKLRRAESRSPVFSDVVLKKD